MSTAVATKTRYTPEDLLAMPDGKSYELVDGQLVERNMGFESSWIGGRLLIRLGSYCEEHGLGWAVPADAGYQCFPHDPDLVRKPDVSFVRLGRLPGGVVPKGWAKIPPTWPSRSTRPTIGPTRWKKSWRTIRRSACL